MSKKNSGTLEAIREIISQRRGDPAATIDPVIRDMLLFGAIIDIYETLEKLQPIVVFYQVGMYFASALGISILALLFGMLTGQIVLSFP